MLFYKIGDNYKEAFRFFNFGSASLLSTKEY